ncbi:hypothetical protein ACLM5H_05400 [Fredinandcohnia humi]
MSSFIVLIITVVVYVIYIYLLRKPNTEDDLYLKETLESKRQLIAKLEKEVTTSKTELIQKQ